jgi:hypothetical protein
MHTSTLRLCSAAFLLSCVGGVALAQRLPDPPTPQQNTGPIRVPNLERFAEAIRKAGGPKLLITTDVVGVQESTGKTLDSTALATRLNARLQDCFRHPEVFIVSGGASAIRRDQDVRALQSQEQFAAAKALGAQANADLVMYVRMIEQSGRADGVRYTGMYVVADLRRGQSIGSYAWDMYANPETGEFDAVRMGDYAWVIAQRMSNDVIDGFPVVAGAGSLRNFTVRLLGDYEDDSLRDFRDALRAMVSVKPDTVRLGREESAAGTKASVFELMYAGDLMDIRSDIRRAAVEKLFMEAAVTSSDDASVTVRLAPVSLTPRERLLAGGDENSRNQQERRTLLERYAKAGSPPIAVVINRIAVAEETSASPEAKPDSKTEPAPQTSPDAPAKPGEGTNIIIGTRLSFGGDGSAERIIADLIRRELADRRVERKEDGLLDTGMFESLLTRRLLQLKLNVVDVSAAQAKVVNAPDASGRRWNDRALAHELATAANAKVVISGVGKLTRDKVSGAPMRLTFTLTAFGVDGRTLAAATVFRDLAPAEESFSQAMDALVAEATGKLVTTMSDVWGM